MSNIGGIGSSPQPANIGGVAEDGNQAQQPAAGGNGMAPSSLNAKAKDILGIDDVNQFSSAAMADQVDSNQASQESGGSRIGKFFKSCSRAVGEKLTNMKNSIKDSWNNSSIKEKLADAWDSIKPDYFRKDELTQDFQNIYEERRAAEAPLTKSDVTDVPAPLSNDDMLEIEIMGNKLMSEPNHQEAIAKDQRAAVDLLREQKSEQLDSDFAKEAVNFKPIQDALMDDIMGEMIDDVKKEQDAAQAEQKAKAKAKKDDVHPSMEDNNILNEFGGGSDTLDADDEAYVKELLNEAKERSDIREAKKASVNDGVDDRTNEFGANIQGGRDAENNLLDDIIGDMDVEQDGGQVADDQSKANAKGNVDADEDLKKEIADDLMDSRPTPGGPEDITVDDGRRYDADDRWDENPPSDDDEPFKVKV